MIRFASLGSGSRGNATVIESGGTRVLLDCGFGPRDLALRLARLDLSARDISAVLVTHEHSDHIAGAFRFALRQAIPVYLTAGTLAAAPRGRHAMPETVCIDSHVAFVIGGLHVHPFPVPHDAREPVQFVFSDGDVRLGVLTDIGSPTPHVEASLSGVDALVLECNHDLDLLQGSDYPAVLKRRISGRFGHLDNDASAALLATLDRSRLQHVVAAHLSEQNNRPELARRALSGVLGCGEEWIGVADQEEGFGWRQVG